MDGTKLKQIIEEIAKGVVSNQVMTRKLYATLVSVSPLKFMISPKVFIYGANCITPKYRVFRPDEIGHTFVFQEDAEGQQFIYCYEATDKPGENGIPYKWTGEIVSAELHGTCPDGAVTVTNGKINVAIHKEGVS